jgi:hypothetical protein
MKMAIVGFNHPQFGPDIKRALETGDGAYLNRLGNSPDGRQLIRLAEDMTPAQIQAGLMGMSKINGMEAIQRVMFTAKYDAEMDRVAQHGNLLGVDGKSIDPLRIIDSFNKADLKDANVALALATKPTRNTKENEQLRQLMTRMGLGDISDYDLQTSLTKNPWENGQGAVQAAIVTKNMIRKQEEMAPDLSASAMKQKIASMLTGTITTSGIGKAIARLKDPKTDLITGLVDVFQDANLLLGNDRSKALTELENASPAQLKIMSMALTEYYDSQEALANTARDPSDPRKDAAKRQRGRAAALRLESLGIQTPGDITVTWDRN